MLQKLISYSVNFIKVIGSLVTGFTALFYATGFMAWNSRLVYLGMPESEIVDINYLITGAQFFVSLPFRFIVGFQFLRWGWTLLLIVAFICGALIGTRDYNKRFNKWTFLATGGLLLAALLIPLRSEGAFFKHLPDPKEQGALFNRDITPLEELTNNYSKLIVFTVFALVGTGLMLSWREKIAAAIPASETEEKSSSGESKEKNTTKQANSSWFVTGFRLGNITSWKTASNFVPFLIALLALIYILILPMNFIHPAVIKRYPVVNIRFNQKDIYPEIQPTTEIFLLKQEKGDKRDLLLYSREKMRILQIKQEYIKELSIIKHQAIWD